jgi:hypothetical protein
MGEVDGVLMRRGVGTMVETELAVVTFVDDLMMIDGGQFGHVTRVHIDPIQQCVERWTEIEAAPATVTDLVDPQRFLLQLLGIDRCDETETFHIHLSETTSGQSSPTDIRHVAEN